MVKILAQLIRWKIGNFKNYFSMIFPAMASLGSHYLSPSLKQEIVDFGVGARYFFVSRKECFALIADQSVLNFLPRVGGDSHSSISSLIQTLLSLGWPHHVSTDLGLMIVLRVTTP